MKLHDPRQRQRRHLDRSLQDPIKDPYQRKRKLAGPVVCPDCGAVFQRGRWRWGARPAQAEAYRCPACQRVREGVPAGYVRLAGEFFERHRGEILQLVRNEEAREKRDHPLQRIMRLREQAAGVEVTTTDVHLARRIGESLRGAFQGELDVKYSRGEHLVRVRWSR